MASNLLCSASTVAMDECPKQAPSVGLSMVRALKELASNKLAWPYERANASGIPSMTLAILMVSDVQRIRSSEVNEDSGHGALIGSKAKKQHGQFRPWDCPRIGIAGTAEWAHPLFDMRSAYKRMGGVALPVTFMRVGRDWHLIAADAPPYSTTRRKRHYFSSRSATRKVRSIPAAHPRIPQHRRTKCVWADSNSISPGVGLAPLAYPIDMVGAFAQTNCSYGTR